MQVVLLKEVKGLGRAGDICEVKEGYAANFLIPNKLAVTGSPENLARATSRKKKEAEARSNGQKEAFELFNSLNKQVITHKVVNTKGNKLKSTIKGRDVVEIIKNKTVNRKGVELKLPSKPHIKEVGKHAINFIVVSTEGISFDKEVAGEFILDVQG